MLDLNLFLLRHDQLRTAWPSWICETWPPWPPYCSRGEQAWPKDRGPGQAAKQNRGHRSPRHRRPQRADELRRPGAHPEKRMDRRGLPSGEPGGEHPPHDGRAAVRPGAPGGTDPHVRGAGRRPGAPAPAPERGPGSPLRRAAGPGPPGREEARRSRAWRITGPNAGGHEPLLQPAQRPNPANHHARPDGQPLKGAPLPG